jgi:uncharacterized protein YjdB
MLGRTQLITTLACAVTAAAMACNYPTAPVTTTPDPTPARVAVQGVRVLPQSVTLLAIGESRQLAVTIMPLDATDQSVIWESTDSSIASVDAIGRVTARHVGSGVLVTAYSGDRRFQSSVAVSVEPARR